MSYKTYNKIHTHNLVKHPKKIKEDEEQFLHHNNDILTLSSNRRNFNSVRVNAAINVNININLENAKIYKDPKNYFPYNDSFTSLISPKSPSKNWKKIKNLFKSINSFRRYQTKTIEDEAELEEDMQDYKLRLFDNTIKIRKMVALSDDELNVHHRKNLFDSKIVNLLIKEEESEKRKNFKDEIYKIILDGDMTSLDVDKIEKILSKDSEFSKGDLSKTKYDSPLSNGKTLLYMACQEGKVEIVNCLLDKKINPFVLSKIDKNEFESPLQVACRWNYINIVNLLLEKVNFKKEHIKEALNIEGITKTVKIILTKYLSAKYKKKRFCC